MRPPPAPTAGLIQDSPARTGGLVGRRWDHYCELIVVSTSMDPQPTKGAPPPIAQFPHTMQVHRPESLIVPIHLFILYEIYPTS